MSEPSDPFDTNPDEGYIRQIFNYCDRWCERCAFTLRCRVYAMETDRENKKAGETSHAIDDDEEEVFLKKLEMPTPEIWEAGESDEEETWRGDDWEDEEFELTQETERREKEAKARGGDLAETAEVYGCDLANFLEDNPELEQGSEDKLEAYLSLPDAHPAELKSRMAQLVDALEVVRWHQFLIMSKIRRAFSSQVDEEIESEILGDLPRDSDGSAKVALIAIDRSLEAWIELGELLPQHARAALDFTLCLDGLCSEMEDHFPNARTFVRPGFDE